VVGCSDPITEDLVDATLVFYGLDNAGKSTIMQILANDRMVVQQPTLHPSALEIIIGKVRFKAFDLAGHETGRRLWKEYFSIASAVFFLVDAADYSRFAEAAEELKYLRSAPELQDVSIAVLGMKTDLKGAAGKDEFCKAMGLVPDALPSNLKVFMCSTVEMNGCHQIGEAVLWLSAKILDHPRPKPSLSVALTEVSSCADDNDMMV